jgi:dephospho-CoA kinase
MEAKVPNQINKKIALGIAGELLCGKSTAADFFIKEYQAKYFKFSALLAEVLDVLDLPHTRINLQDIAALLKKEFSEEVLVDALAKRANRSEAQFLLFDGLRKPEEVAAVRAQISNFKLIYIEAKLETRFARQQLRNEKPGESSKTLEELIESQKHSADASIPLLIKDADYVVHNDADMDSFLKQLQAIVEKETA